MFVYNLVSYASQAIESVLAQRAPFDYELVIGDDCSTGGTRELLVQYARAEPGRSRLVLPHRVEHWPALARSRTPDSRMVGAASEPHGTAGAN